jgi:hypothetical protein
MKMHIDITLMDKEFGQQGSVILSEQIEVPENFGATRLFQSLNTMMETLRLDLQK